MTNSMNLNDVGTQLTELVTRMQPGDEMNLVADGAVVAVINRVEQGPWGCQPGSAKDVAIWMADDFDAPLEDFDETAP